MKVQGIFQQCPCKFPCSFFIPPCDQCILNIILIKSHECPLKHHKKQLGKKHHNRSAPCWGGDIPERSIYGLFTYICLNLMVDNNWTPKTCSPKRWCKSHTLHYHISHRGWWIGSTWGSRSLIYNAASDRDPLSIPIGFLYMYIHGWLVFMVNKWVCKHSSLIDATGKERFLFFEGFGWCPSCKGGFDYIPSSSVYIWSFCLHLLAPSYTDSINSRTRVAQNCS